MLSRKSEYLIKWNNEYLWTYGYLVVLVCLVLQRSSMTSAEYFYSTCDSQEEEWVSLSSLSLTL